MSNTSPKPNFVLDIVMYTVETSKKTQPRDERFITTRSKDLNPHFSSASSNREETEPGGGEGVKVGLVQP